MNDFELTTPVALFIFNRPDVTKEVFEAIRAARPLKLLVVADGPRSEMTGEKERCEVVRKIIETIDWDCEVLKNYSAVNMGCRARVSSGLDWVFENVEEAIILEDDCLPNQSFFRFCEEMLTKYRFDERIMMISGTNLVGDCRNMKHSYFFSKYPHIWGWASWRRSWGFYDVNISSWPAIRDSLSYRNFSVDRKECHFWKELFDKIYEGKMDTWDAQITYMFFCQNGLTIIPRRNMISNIGFGKEATHTTNKSDLADLASFDVDWPLSHPKMVMRDLIKDKIRKKREYTSSSFAARLLQEIRKIYERDF